MTVGEFVYVEKIPVCRAAGTAIEVHSRFLNAIGIQVSIGHIIDADQRIMRVLIRILAGYIEVMYTFYDACA